MARVLRGLDLNTQVVHNIVAVGSTTPPRCFPFFFLSPFHFVSSLSLPSALLPQPSLLHPCSFFFLPHDVFVLVPRADPPSRRATRRFRGTLSSIKAEGIDAEMIEHCAPQCSSMYRSSLRAQREYVIHRSNWTMIDDTMSAPLCLLVPTLSAVRLLPFFFSSFFRRCSFLFVTSRGSNPPRAEHRARGTQSSRFPLFVSFLPSCPLLSSSALSPSPSSSRPSSVNLSRLLCPSL